MGYYAFISKGINLLPYDERFLGIFVKRNTYIPTHFRSINELFHLFRLCAFIYFADIYHSKLSIYSFGFINEFSFTSPPKILRPISINNAFRFISSYIFWLLSYYYISNWTRVQRFPGLGSSVFCHVPKHVW